MEIKIPELPDGPEYFTDKHGACKICGGEIPYGHLNNCCHYQLTLKVTELEAAVLHGAAECHRSKWQFDYGEDSDGNRIASPAFDELHRIGDFLNKALKGD